MLFNSFDFVIFAIIFFTLWPWARRGDNLRWSYITLASFIFYGWWDWRFLFLIIGSGIFNYVLGQLIYRHGKPSKILLFITILGNLGVLGIFKYFDFTVHNFNWFLQMFGYGHTIPLPELILPVGISFYTFQAMSYCLDIYRKELKPARNILHFMAYLSCFPQLVAGPIVRASDFLPQLEHPGKATDEDRWEGLKLIVFGYFKKCVIADNLAPLVNMAFADHTAHSGMLYWWLIMLAFAFQIYGDFSGYSDIARGLARWMGYNFILNFNHPYVACSFRDFWGRWHISLSTWFRDYVYIPLGGNRCSPARANFNMFITMVTSGFWHGASWNYVIWGTLHGIYLWLERILKWPERLKKIPAGKYIGIIITFAGVIFAWVFFRAQDLKISLYVIHNMVAGKIESFALDYGWIRGILAIGVMLIIEIAVLFNLPTSPIWEKPQLQIFKPISLALIALVSLYCRGIGNAFIYFQF